MTAIEELLREHSEGVPAGDEVERRALDRGRRAVRAAAAVEPARTRGRAGPWGSARSLLWLAPVAAVAVAIALIFLVLPRHAGRRVAPVPALHHGPLRPLAQLPSRPLRPGEYFYYRSLSSNPGHNGPASKNPTFIENGWVAPNGYARLVQTGPGAVIAGGDVLVFHAGAAQLRAEHARQRHGARLRVMAYGQQYRWVDLSYQQLVGLPTDTALLRRWIERHAIGSGPRDGVIYSYAEALIRGAPLPPRLAAAFYRMIATLPEMRVIGPAKDALGRPGVAIGFFGGAGARGEMIFDPRTGLLLGERTVSTSTSLGAAPGTVLGWYVIAARGVVSSPTETTSGL